MIHPNFRFWRSLVTMLGAIIGVGIFGLPYAFAQSGFVVGMIIMIITVALIVIMQLMLAEVVTQTKGVHRLVGYIGMYLGRHWAWIGIIVLALSIWGAMVAYMIVGGTFLQVLSEPFFQAPETVYSLTIALVAGALMFKGIQFASKMEVGVMIALLLLFSLIFIISLTKFEPSNLASIHLDQFLLPYGVVLFAFAGIGIVPELKSILGQKQISQLPWLIIIGMTIIFFIYTAFIIGVLGVTGEATTQAAFDGLVPIFGSTFGAIGALLGVIIILSIYTILGVTLQNMLRYDFHVPKFPAWLIVAGTPILAFLIGLTEFISLVGIVGGVFVGLIGILVVLTYEKMRKSPVCVKHECLDIPHIFSWLIILIFAGGAVLSIL